MIKKVSHNIKRNGKVLSGQILNTEFFVNKHSPFRYYNEKTKHLEPREGRGFSKYRNGQFLIVSGEKPAIKACGFRNNGSDMVVALHVWGKDKSQDNNIIEIKFRTVKLAKLAMNLIEKRGEVKTKKMRYF